GNGSAQLVVVFAPVQGFLDVLPQGRVINIVDQVKAAVNAIVFPKGALGSAIARLCVHLAHDRALGGFLQSQGHEDGLALIPFSDNKVLPDLPNGLDDRVAVAAWMMEGDKRVTHFVIYILVAWSKPTAAKHMQQREVQVIGAVRVGGMNLRLNVRAVVV